MVNILLKRIDFVVEHRCLCNQFFNFQLCSLVVDLEAFDLVVSRFEFSLNFAELAHMFLADLREFVEHAVFELLQDALHSCVVVGFVREVPIQVLHRLVHGILTRA